MSPCEASCVGGVEGWVPAWCSAGHGMPSKTLHVGTVAVNQRSPRRWSCSSCGPLALRPHVGCAAPPLVRVLGVVGRVQVVKSFD